jgi:type IV secretion system protein VirD4
LNQLEKAYGPHNSILDNCHIRLTYAANDDRTARRISDLLGQATEKRLQRSYSGSGIFLTHRSESEHEYGRPLLTPAEVNQLPQDDGILLVGGLLPYRARKVRYFLDPRFKGRGGLPPPDTAEEQRRELPLQVTGDWEGLARAPLPEELSPSAAVEASCEPAIADPSGGSQQASAHVVESLWESFFASQDRPTSPNEPLDSKGAASTERKDLPL